MDADHDTAGNMGYLRNQFLIAMPGLGDDDHFGQTVTLLCEHNDEGALGLVVNRPTDLKVTDMLAHLGLDASELGDRDSPVFWGGPVQPERGFVVHVERGDWESTMAIDDALFVTTSRDILDAIATGEGPRQYLVLLGYAGWDAGQLESEILHNAWLNTPVDQQILFRTPTTERWREATRLLGVDSTQLSATAGHA
ncbi:MAG: YqgE/AlgH family protein [Algiphilus sp.]